MPSSSSTSTAVLGGGAAGMPPPATTERPQGRRSILPRGQHSSSSRSSSTGHGGADPAPRAPSGYLPRASASASDSQWTAVFLAAPRPRSARRRRTVRIQLATCSLQPRNEFLDAPRDHYLGRRIFHRDDSVDINCRIGGL